MTRFTTAVPEATKPKVVTLAVDGNGVDVLVNGYYVVGILEDGTLQRYGGNDAEETGLRLNHDGEILLVEEVE